MKGGGLEKTADLEGPKCLKMLPIERQTDMKDEEPDPEVRHTFFPSHSTYMIVPIGDAASLTVLRCGTADGHRRRVRQVRAAEGQGRELERRRVTAGRDHQRRGG